MGNYHINSIQPGTKILFANFPGDGHFNPLTGLAAHLKSMGCDVRWYTAKKYEEKIQRLGIPFYGLDKALDLSANSEIEKFFPERKKHKSQVAKLKFDMINVFILRSTEYYEDIKEIYKEFEFELMIADIMFGAIPFIKEKMKIPVIAVSVVPLPETSKDLPPPGLGLTPSYSFFGKIKQSLLRRFSDALLFAEPTKVMRKILADHGIDAGKANIFDILIQKSTIVLQSGTPGFEYQRSDISNHIYFAGPLLPYTKKREGQPWYNDKLREYEKVILVTQGTVEKDIDKLLIPTLEVFKNSDCLVIVTTGGSQTEELRQKYAYPNIIIEDFIPFDDVMPYADVYVTNGGYGGVLLSVQNQLPMVVAGVHEGKNEINARVGYFKLGINLKTETPSIPQLKKSVEEVLENDVYSKNVKRLNEEFKKYNPNEICVSQAAKLLRSSAIEKVLGY
ncbi:MAG TPA: nucleotide disphospho-sugar-binding domain-containing protein [Flavisolibacter sp.]|jgi:MGT family glycosyltransferase|nr:nucleotide disphospho-sugar-binding domain-containing protein [Flavisolibacter sp.]